MLQNQNMKLKLGGAQNSLCGQETTQKQEKSGSFLKTNTLLQFGLFTFT
jgi:hypothetical protein